MVPIRNDVIPLEDNINGIANSIIVRNCFLDEGGVK